jgi:hypothetical protein
VTIRTLDDLVDALDADLAWRRKELTDLRFRVRDSKGSAEERLLLRAGVAILYAHWEGFVKYCCTSYLAFVRRRGLKYSELSECFVALSLRPRMRALMMDGRARDQTEFASFMRSSMDKRAALRVDDEISTRSNLNSDTLREMLDSVGLDFAPFELKRNLIDEQLLKNRNSIAHGNYALVDMDLFESLYSEMLPLIDQVRTQTENAASTGAYKAA